MKLTVIGLGQCGSRIADHFARLNMKARTQRKALARILDIAAERLGGSAMAEAAIVDIDSPETGDAVAERVVERFGPTLLHRASVSPVVGAIVGPGAIGLAFYGEK